MRTAARAAPAKAVPCRRAKRQSPRDWSAPLAPLLMRFVEEGAYVFITGRRQAELDHAEKEIGKCVTAVRGEVSNLEAAPVKFIAC